MFQEISRAFNGAENGYLTYGLDNRDNYYMRRVYLACIRCIDFLTALPEWDEKMSLYKERVKAVPWRLLLRPSTSG